jgi:hypothetical protein
MMQHPGAYATTNAWFETNSSFSPARIDLTDNPLFSPAQIDLSSNSSFPPARIDHVSNNDGDDGIIEAYNSASLRECRRFLASKGTRSSAFAPGQVRDGYGTG